MLNKAVLISSSHESARVNNELLQTNIDLIASAITQNESELAQDFYAGSTLTITEKIYLIQSHLGAMINTRKTYDTAISNHPALQLPDVEYLALLDRADHAWYDLQLLINILISNDQDQSIIDLATAIKQVYQL